MSKHDRPRQKDEGMALPELLVGVIITGLLMSVLSAALITILRQRDNSAGRLNNARSENGVGFFMPGDLASAQSIAENDGSPVNTDADASPCYGACPAGINTGGSNALQMEWSTQIVSGASVVDQWTKVSYRYVFVNDEYQLIRIECKSIDGKASSSSCEQNVVLHGLDGPPDGTPFIEGVTPPTWIINVSSPPPADATDDESSVDPGLKTKNAQKVVVTINGGGDVAGAGGGENKISLSAGGTDREIIDATSLQGAPNLISARSRCGGTIALIIDESASISDADFILVKAAVVQFVTAFVGTPVKLKLVPFHSVARVMGSTATGYYDMLNTDQVDELFSLIDSDLSGKDASGVASGRTNWEDAMLRTFYRADGALDPIQPRLVIFFTDGVPTLSRPLASSISTGVRPLDPPAAMVNYPAATLSSYHHESFERADYIAQTFRSSPDVEKFIGVGVGGDINDTQDYITGVTGLHYTYSRKYAVDDYLRWYHIENGFHFATYQRGYHITASKYYFSAPFTAWQTISYANMNNFASVDGASNLTPPGSGSRNYQVYATKNVSSTDTTGTSTDGWVGSGTKTFSSSYYDWEDSSTQTSPTTSSTPNRRVSFKPPYLFSRDVTSSWNSNGTQEGATSWGTTVAPKNNSMYASQNDSAQPYEYNADGWSVTLTPSSSGTIVIPNDGTGYDDDDDSWVRTAVYSEPFTDYVPVTVDTYSWEILGELVGGSAVEEAELVAGEYVNIETANLYVLPDWNDFEDALLKIALNECGGTLTLQTKNGTVAALDPFTYQKTALWDADGIALESDMTVVRTTKNFPSGTFDVRTSDGRFVTLEIQPQELSDVTTYNPGTWKCRAGVTNRDFTLVDIPGSDWKGIRVEVGANEAVSCTQTVSQG